MSSLLNFSSLTADTTIYYILYFIYLLLICKDGERTLDDKWAVRLPINLCIEIPSKPRFLESSKTFDETFIHLLARRFSLRFAGWTRIGRNRTLGSSKRNLISLFRFNFVSNFVSNFPREILYVGNRALISYRFVCFVICFDFTEIIFNYCATRNTD